MVAAAIRMPRTAADADNSLSPLPPALKRGLTAVTAFGFLSLVSTVVLIVYMVYRFVTLRKRNSHGARMNQFVVLIFNLILADLHQAIGFSLNISWLARNSITSYTSTCWAQGWFLNAGDVSSGLFTFAIAVHAFADIVFNFRLGRVAFLFCILGLWVFDYFVSTIGIALHQDDFYMRAGPWCWISEKYMAERLWFHYFWIILIEFSSVVIYALTFLILRRRSRTDGSSLEYQFRAAYAAKIVIAYPIIYVICTLPAVIVRLHIMNGGSVNFVQFCVIGVFMCSNGWLDALLYSLTRWTLIFGPMATEDVRAVDTYTTWSQFRSDHHFGNTTTIESTPPKVPQATHLQKKRTQDLHSSQESGDSNRRGASIVKTETIVDVHREVCSPLERMMIQRMNSEIELGRSQSPVGSDIVPHFEEMPNLEFLSENDKEESCAISEVAIPE